MKNELKLTSRISLINKKFKKNQYYHFLKTPEVSIIIPIIKDKFLLVSQKREPINKISFEFPSGQIDKGESPIKSSTRELLEETGYKAYNAKKLISFYSEAGRLSTKNYCFYTKKINKISKKEKGINIHLYSKNKIINLIKQNRFSNSPHIAAFFFYLNLK